MMVFVLTNKYLLKTFTVSVIFTSGKLIYVNIF